MLMNIACRMNFRYDLPQVIDNLKNPIINAFE